MEGAPRQHVLELLRVDAEALAVWRLLDEAGVDAVLLKGATLERWLYPDGGRAYGDVDLAVDPGRFAEAEAVLAATGRARDKEAPDEHSVHWTADGAVTVDLHRSYAYVTAGAPAFWAALWREREPFTLAAGELRAPSIPFRALLAALHYPVHAAHRHVAEDLRRVIAQLPDAQWAQVGELADELGARDGLTTALRGIDGGAAIADRLALPARGGRAIELDLVAAPAVAQRLQEIEDAPDTTSRLAILARRVLPPADELRRHHALARRGRRGLIATYALRPLRLLRDAPEGVAAWRDDDPPPAV